MATSYPLRELSLVAASVADDLGFVALADIGALLEGMNRTRDSRLIGGHMVTLHVQRWGLGRELYRETADADLGLATVAVKRTPPATVLQQQGYTRTSGGRFEKVASAPSGKAVIDILVPAHTSRARRRVEVGELVTTEVPASSGARRGERHLTTRASRARICWARA